MIHTTQECRIGDAVELLRAMPPESVDTVITSPPYHSLRDYGVSGQIGMEPTLEEYHDRLLEVTAELYRVMKSTSVLFWNHGDSYGGSGGAGGDHNKGGLREGQPKVGRSVNTVAKCLTMQNERLIMRMVDEQGFVLRNRIIWHKNNGMPSSVQDRFANKYEPIYMLVKSNNPAYYCNSKTGAMQRDKPPGTKGEEGVDWDSREVMSEDCSTGEVSTEIKKVSYWRGHDYWFDLDSVRVPHKDATEVKYRMKLRKNKNYNVKAPYGSNTPYRHNSARTTSQESPNRIWGDNATLDRLIASGKNPGDVWTIPTQPFSGSHFAVFPPPLIEPMIKAGCPAEICPVCGLPRVRVVDREFVPQQDVSEAKGIRGANDQKPMDASNQWQGVPRGTTTHRTTGWTSCSCGAGYVAGTVLDPFCGSGTVLEVCRLLNRNAIGIELNPEYAPMIRERSMSHTPPLTAYFGAEQEEAAP